MCCTATPSKKRVKIWSLKSANLFNKVEVLIIIMMLCDKCVLLIVDHETRI